MKIFVDSNILVAVLVEEEERFLEAKRLLNSDHQIMTSMLNLMEVRSVLSKKKNRRREEIEQVEQDIVELADIVIPDSSDFLEANKLQKESYAYPMDSLIIALADNSDAELASFDREMIENGAKTPEEIFSS
jgi:predicted nucleic acid-binding protein